MKRIAVLAMAVFMMSLSVPVCASDMSKEQKDECLLASKNCKNSVDSIQQKIKKLNNEINKGDKVYSPEELKKLNEKLKDAENMLDNMLYTE